MNHVYIARNACGCITAAVFDYPGSPEDTAVDVASFIRSGRTVERIEADSFLLGSLGCIHKTDADLEPGSLAKPINRLLLEALKVLTNALDPETDPDPRPSADLLRFARQAITEAEHIGGPAFVLGASPWSHMCRLLKDRADLLRTLRDIQLEADTAMLSCERDEVGRLTNIACIVRDVLAKAEGHNA